MAQIAPPTIKRMEYNQSTSLLQTRNTTEELELTVTNLEEAKPTLFAIRKSRSLKRLLLASSGHDKEVLAVCRFALEGSYALEALTLEFVNCSDEGIHNVVIALKTIVKLASVTFRLNNVTHVGAGAIADLLESKNLDRFSIHGTQMDLHDLCIGDAGALCIAMSTQKCLTLKHLTISHCGLTDMGVAQIMPYLELHPSLSSLDLSGNAISKKGVSIIFHLLPQLSRIKELILDNNRIGNAAFDQLSPSATSHTHSLKTLSVKSCSITKDSIMLLIKGIEELDVLNLGGNKDIGNDGAYLLSKHLRNDSSLKSLDLSSCGIEDEGCVCLGDSLVSNTSLLQLCLHRNYIGDSGIVALATALQTNR